MNDPTTTDVHFPRPPHGRYEVDSANRSRFWPQPMPNDTVTYTDGTTATVVASVEYTDGPQLYTVLLLNQTPRRNFTVAHVTGDGNVNTLGTHENIVPAVDQYRNCGGDY